jgi:Xaa-Pro aminopeptidase
LVDKFEKALDERVQSVLREPWERLHKAITHIRAKMEPRDGDKPQRLFETMLTNTLELCDVLEDLNVANDDKLNEVIRTLRASLEPVDIQSIRESVTLRDSTKAKMDELLEKFSF